MVMESLSVERTYLARSPQVLQQLNNIDDFWNELGTTESGRLKDCYGGGELAS